MKGWRAFLDSHRRRRRIQLAAERHIEREFSCYLTWSTGPYSDGTTYQRVVAWKPTPGDRIGRILGDGTGRTQTKALFDLHRRLNGRPDQFDRWFLALQFIARQDRAVTHPGVTP